MRARNVRFMRALFAHRPEPPASTLAFSPTAAAENPPPEFTWREYAVFLLSIAAQIEHSLMVQYLYAAWSLGGPQVPEEHRDSVAAWRQIILGIAKEEMGHLATVQNLLRFFGAPIALDREDYPWDSDLAPYPFALERLTRVTLAKYILAESPEEWPDDVSDEERQGIEKLSGGPGAQRVNRVGALYGKLIELIGDANKVAVWDFHPETYPTQSSWDEYARGYGKGARGSSIVGTKKTPDVLVMRAASRSDALAALRAVAEQGEAPQQSAAADDEASHFRRFLTAFRAFPTDATWDPSIPVPDNPVGPGLPAGAGQTAIKDTQAGLWAGIFNVRYRMLLSFLAHSHSPPGAQDLDRRQGVVINRMFGEMYNLRSVASILTGLPLGHGDERRAAPTFQMPYTLQLPDSDEAFWRLHIDLIEACRPLLSDRIVATGRGKEYASFLLRLDSNALEEMRLYATASRIRTGPRYRSSE